MKHILIIDAHPASTSLCSALVESYVAGASGKGVDVREVHLRDLEFDPILHEGYNHRQQWEPDLENVWQAIEQADHMVFVFPTWWGGHPALLQGFFERVFLPGKVAEFHEKGSGWDRLLVGKTAQIITTMDTPYWYYRCFNRDCGIRRVKQTILEFTGLKVQVQAFGGVNGSDQHTREKWLEKAGRLGATAAK
jgi:putative NADPH-quinone reductase